MRTALAFLVVSALGLVGCDTSSSGAGGGATGSGSGVTNGAGTTSSMSSATMSTSASGMTSTGSGTGGGSFAGTTRVDVGMGSAVPGSAEAAVAPDGTIYVTWVLDTGGKGDVYLARSTDGGMTFESAIQLDNTSIEPLVSMARHPYVFATDTRVGVTFNDQAGNVYLYASAVGGALAFGSPTLVGTDIVTSFRDFPKGFFLPDGSIAVAYQGYPNSGARIFVARESAGYASVAASSGAPGVPCECCPLDALVTASGDVIVAFRNNDDDTREMWNARAPAAGAFSAWGAVSNSEGFLNVCPMQGPRLAELGGGKLLAVWSARGNGNSSNGTVYSSVSTNGGTTWSASTALSGFVADEPSIAVGADGHIFVMGVTGNQKSSIIESSDGGSNWGAAAPIEVPDGAIAVPQPDSRNGVVVIAGVSAAKTVWLARVE